MKGVINKGIQELVERRFGTSAWEAVRREAGCEEPSFSPGLDYPDEMTFDLVAAAANRTGQSTDDILVEFGEHWITHTVRETYPTLFALAGNNPRAFLRNANHVHAWVTLSIADAHPPKLTAEDLPDGALAVHYTSERNLCPAVHGLIRGIGTHSGQALRVEETSCTRRGDLECIFVVRFP